MAKVLVVPDARLNIRRIEHGMELAKRYRADSVVLMGNYFDPVEGETATMDDYKKMWEYLKDLARNNMNVIPLIGEHELSYLNCSTRLNGHNGKFRGVIRNELVRHQRFMPCVAIDGVLYSNCGVTTEWLRRYKIMLENEIRFRLGKNGGAALIENAICKLTNWIPFFDGKKNTASCMRASVKDLTYSAPPNVPQVVGNALVSSPMPMGRIWFVNSVDENEYMMFNNGEPQMYVYLGEEDDSGPRKHEENNQKSNKGGKKGNGNDKSGRG